MNVPLCCSVAAQQRVGVGLSERRRIVIVAVAAVVVPLPLGRAAPHAAPARAAALRLHLPQLARRPAPLPRGTRPLALIGDTNLPARSL